MQTPTLSLRLPVAGLLLAAIAWSGPGYAESNAPEAPAPIVQPEITRRDVAIPRIEASDFEFGLYAGLLSIENFGSDAVYGARLVYHVTEDYLVEAVYGRSTVSDEAFCNVGLCLFPEREEPLSYYALSAGYNLFPNEVFVGKSYAMNSAVYLLGGLGNTSFAEEDHFTINFGLGIRILPRDWLALHVTIRDYIFDFDLLGTRERTHNFELTGGVSVYF
jgi:outer membrane beta-barrel protein